MNNFEDDDEGRQEISINDEGEQQGVKKVEVDKTELDKLPFDSVVAAKTWPGIEPFLHLGLIGATNSGKTRFFKQLLADQKIPICDIYIVVGNTPGKSELVTGFAALEYLSTGAYKSKKYLHFMPHEIEEAIAYCMDDSRMKETKFLFLNDCLITTNKIKNQVANFANKAKNWNTTLGIEVHSYAGENMVLLRNALKNKVYFEFKPKQLALALDMSVNDNIIAKYAGLSKGDEIVIEGEGKSGLFNKHYLPF